MGRRRSTGWDSRRAATVRIWAASPARLAPRIRCFCCVAHLARHGPGQRQLSPVPTVAPRPRHPDPSGRRQQRRRLRHAAPQGRCRSGWPACRPPRVRLAGAHRPPRTGRARGPEGPAHATDDHNLGRLSALAPLGAPRGTGRVGARDSSPWKRPPRADDPPNCGGGVGKPHANDLQCVPLSYMDQVYS